MIQRLMRALSWPSKDEFGRRWCWWPMVSAGSVPRWWVGVGLGLYLVRFKGEWCEPLLVAHHMLDIELSPKEWGIGQWHDWYDGPNCKYSLGPFGYETSGGDCKKCSEGIGQ